MPGTKGRTRRTHPAALKAKILAACAEPGASIARIALDHGINANVVHRWRRIAEGRERGPHARPPVEFVPLPITGASVEPSPVDIRIEFRRAGTTITISWPVTAAGACSTWLRDLLS
jgi:transposase